MAKFKVGDKVRVENDVRTSGVLNGEVGDVIGYDEDGDALVKMSFDRSDDVGTPFGEDELELVAHAKGGDN